MLKYYCDQTFASTRKLDVKYSSAKVMAFRSMASHYMSKW